MRRLLTLAVVGGLLMSGCAEEQPVPKLPTPTLSATSSPSASPSASASTAAGSAVPQFSDELLHEGTLEAAQEFARHYWAMVDYAEDTGDVAPLEALAQPGCASCESGVKWLTGIYSRGGLIESGPQRVTDLSGDFRAQADPSVAALVMTVSGERYRVKENPAAKYEILPAGSSQVLMDLVLTKRGWRVLQWSRP